MALQNVQRLFWKSNSNKNITCCNPDIKSKQQINRYLMKRSIAGEKETTIYIEREETCTFKPFELYYIKTLNTRVDHCTAMLADYHYEWSLFFQTERVFGDTNVISSSVVRTEAYLSPVFLNTKVFLRTINERCFSATLWECNGLTADTICQGASSINAFPSKFLFFFGFEKLDETKCRLLCAALQSMYNKATGLQ